MTNVDTIFIKLTLVVFLVLAIQGPLPACEITARLAMPSVGVEVGMTSAFHEAEGGPDHPTSISVDDVDELSRTRVDAVVDVPALEPRSCGVQTCQNGTVLP